MKRLTLILASCLLALLQLAAQQPQYAKMSAWVRRAAVQAQETGTTAEAKGLNGTPKGRERMMTAFVEAHGIEADDVLRAQHCATLARLGDVRIVAIPLSALAPLSASPAITRIEANEPSRTTMDSVPLQVHALPVYQGDNLPQAYTGKGVMVGVQDIGFDLTHPNFYSPDLSHYRIHALWDMLSADTVGSPLYVGRDYRGQEALLALGRPRDGDDQTHGTHTTGIAAGSGYNSKYRGMAYESDIALVCNATSDDINLIDSADYYKYTSATDVLGFKYLFDMADSMGEPCVINFSEGSPMDFYGEDLLYGKALKAITGPGHIFVTSAGNNGLYYNYMLKPAGTEQKEVYLYDSKASASMTLKADKPFIIVIHTNKDDASMADSMVISTADVLACSDSTLTDTLRGKDQSAALLTLQAYPSCYNAAETCYDLTLADAEKVKSQGYYTVEVRGSEAEVECFNTSRNLWNNPRHGEKGYLQSSHNINSPACLDAAIAVGSNAYRTQWLNYKGEVMTFNQGTDGYISRYSSTGPTYSMMTKPDVVAPGTIVISSYSSFYEGKHPNANDINSDVEHFYLNGRMYAWNSNSGTSMASPVVAGAIALWLEADPTLSPTDIKDILAKTCRHPDPSLDYPNNTYGQGEIDVYAGLVEVLRRKATGLQAISSHHAPRANVNISGERLRVDFFTELSEPVRLRLYATSGLLMRQTTVSGHTQSCEMSLNGLPKGVYVLQIDSADERLKGSYVFRWM